MTQFYKFWLHTHLMALWLRSDNELYSSTNGSSKYHYDPQYGGKISLTGFQGRDGDACEILPSPNMPPTAVPDRPRIVHDPSYADEQSRCCCSLNGDSDLHGTLQTPDDESLATLPER